MKRADAASGVAIWSRAYAVEKRLPETEKRALGLVVDRCWRPDFSSSSHIYMLSLIQGLMSMGIFGHIGTYLGTYSFELSNPPQNSSGQQARQS